MSNQFNNVSDDDLVDQMNILPPVRRDQIIVEATIRLKKSVDEFNKKSGDQTKKMIGLTWAIAVLTVLMLIGLITQIILNLKT